MKNNITAIIIIGFFLLGTPLFESRVLAYTPVPGSPLANNERPRIFITPSSLSVIAHRALTTHSLMYANLKLRADELLTVAHKAGYAGQAAFDRTAILSLVALIEKKNGHPGYTAYRDRAFMYAQHVVDNSNVWNLTSKYTGNSIGIRATAGTLSLVYDWLHDELSPELKTNIHNFLLNIYKGLLNIDRPSGVGAVRRSIYGSSYYLEWGALPWFSVALYGDGEGDELLINKALDDTKNEVFNYTIPAMNMLGGALHNGWGYELGDVGLRLHIGNLLVWQTATNEAVFTDSFALKEFPKYFLYASRPDGSLSKINDTADHYSNPEYPYGTGQWGRAFARSMLIHFVDIYGDGYAKYIVDKQDFAASGNSSNRGWMNLIFYDDTVTERLPSTLPLVRFFPQTGILFGRSGWGADDLYYTFRNRDQYGSHSDAKQNSFTIFQKGSPLAINDGNYPAGFSAAASTNEYYRRTLSSNSMLIYDPSETWMRFGPMLNDGGQRYGWYNPTTGTAGYKTDFNSQDYDQASFDASDNNSADNIFEDEPSYTYIQGDATRGYSDKVTQYTREFVHLKQNYFVILDRVGSTNKTFRKKWLLHSITEPALNGTEAFSCPALIGESACQGTSSAGISKSMNSKDAVITNGSGKLFLRTLLPENSIVRKVGGPGYMFWHDVANKDIPPQWYTPSVTGGWRLEISPQMPDDDADGESLDLFLHLLYPTSSATSSMPDTVLISNEKGNMSSNNMLGIHIKDGSENKVILFSSDPKGIAVSGSIHYSIAISSSKIRHNLHNLPANQNYDIQILSDGGVIMTPTPSGFFKSTGNGVLSFLVGNGIIDTISPSPPTGVRLSP